MSARGLRNNNPGNIRHGSPWQGLSQVQPDTAFCRFDEPEWGIRAMARILLAYQAKRGRNSVRQIIDRWAPPNENDTEAYIQAVAKRLGVAADDQIVVKRYDVMRPLVEAIIKHENGSQPYTADQINEGLRRAGVEIPP
jgi:hypothetical protein